MDEQVALQNLQRAISLARENVISAHGGPFGAVIAKDDQVIATGVNCVTTSNDPTAHAEVVAIRAACAKMRSFMLAGCTLYTSCEPCPMCFGAIYWARIKDVYFASSKDDAADAGFDDSFIYQQLAMKHAMRLVPMCQLRCTEAAEVFALWRAAEHKVSY